MGKRKFRDFFEFNLDSDEELQEQQEQQETEEKEFKKDEVLKLISTYMKKDPSISKDLDKLIDRPPRTDEDIIFDFKALALKNKKVLKESLGELIDKDKDVQKIVDDLATPPKPVDQPKPVDPPKPVVAPVPFAALTAPLLPAAFDPEDYAEEVIKVLREYPAVRDIVLTADTTPSEAEAFFDGWNDPKHKKVLTREQATKIASNDDRFRTLAEAIARGRIHVEKRVADRDGKPTNRLFPEEPKKGPK